MAPSTAPDDGVAPHDALHIGRQEGGDAHHQRTRDAAAEAADGDDPIVPEFGRQQWLRPAPL